MHTVGMRGIARVVGVRRAVKVVRIRVLMNVSRAVRKTFEWKEELASFRVKINSSYIVSGPIPIYFLTAPGPECLER